jgi:hypothetical protein
MTRIHRGLDEVVIAAMVGVIFIALAYVEGLAPHFGAAPPAPELRAYQGEPVVVLMQKLGGAAQ